MTMNKPCTQCKGTGSHPQFTRQVCSKCKGSRVELDQEEPKDNSILVDRGIYKMGSSSNGERISYPSWESNLEGGSVVLGKADTPLDMFHCSDIEGIMNYISEKFKLPTKLKKFTCKECDFEFYIKDSSTYDPLNCPACGESLTLEDDQED